MASQTALAATKGSKAQATTTVSPPFAPMMGPRGRVLVVNDLSGDADGLVAAAHAVLSPSAQVRGIVGTAARQPAESAQRSTELAEEMLRLMSLSGTIPVHRGADRPLTGPNAPADCPGARAIVAEAMRESELPLYVTVGGGLTEIASALLLEPRIAERLTVIWIGGNPHDVGGPEYNFNLDREAARFIFNEALVPLWQVTSKAYGTCYVSMTELQAHVAPCGALGAWLYAKIAEGYPGFTRIGANPGETWSMGDNPLVLLTALTGWLPNSRTPPFRYEQVSSPFDEVFVAANHGPQDEGVQRCRHATHVRRLLCKNADDLRQALDRFAQPRTTNYRHGTQLLSERVLNSPRWLPRGLHAQRLGGRRVR
jgi:purine nucleosidase